MSANIESLVKKHLDRDGWSLAPDGEVASAIRAALTEQAEAFKGELQAYDGMVRELTKTVEDMRAAQSVPVVGDAVGFVLLHEDGGKNLTFHDNTGELSDGWSQHKLVIQPTNSIPAAELATLRELAETHAIELRAYETTVANLEGRIRVVSDALTGLVAIAHDSDGVAGYHKNGDIAGWYSFPEFEAAVIAIDAAIAQEKGE